LEICIIIFESRQKRPKANASLRGGTTKQSVAQQDIDCFASLAMTRLDSYFIFFKPYKDYKFI